MIPITTVYKPLFPPKKRKATGHHVRRPCFLLAKTSLVSGRGSQVPGERSLAMEVDQPSHSHPRGVIDACYSLWLLHVIT